MKFRFSNKVSVFPHYLRLEYDHHCRQFSTSFLRKLQTNPQVRASFSGGSNNSQGNTFLLPGATFATLLMLGALHARRMYDDRKVEEAREKGIEIEFKPDAKASFLRLLPLRSISRFWGFLTSVEYPVWMRPYVYKAWARAFHSNLEEAALPLGEYASLREFFVRTLKQGSRPIDPDPHCLVSPVDGIVLRVGELKGVGAMIEQVKGFSYSVSSLLGSSSFLPMIEEGDMHEQCGEQESSPTEKTKKSWWSISLASPRVRDTAITRPVKGLYYCVIYLKPGNYHRIHSPVDWNVLVRRHFSGRLFPLNERATRTIRNLYFENERLVIEPELRTNRPRKKLLHSEPPEERVYEPQGVGMMLKKGDEVGAFNMGSTVVLVFQAPTIKSPNRGDNSNFRFCIKRGDKIRVGEGLGRWQESCNERASF
ncbi:phosphatidylserine decarboxylase proenzyme 1 [Citrus sinensis]|nr:phosphatidylserine decarboxylase proenzyme 1 [Citrus sinensis]